MALQGELLGLVDDAHVPVTDDLLDAAARDDGARGKGVRGRSRRLASGDRARSGWSGGRGWRGRRARRPRGCGGGRRRSGWRRRSGGGRSGGRGRRSGGGAAWRRRRGGGRRRRDRARSRRGSGGSGRCRRLARRCQLQRRLPDAHLVAHLRAPGAPGCASRSRTSRWRSRGPRSPSGRPASRVTTAWRRDSSGSSPSCPTPASARPITNSSSRAISLALGPALPHDQLLHRRRGQAGRRRGPQLGRRRARGPTRRSPPAASCPAAPCPRRAAFARRRSARRSRTCRWRSPRSSIVSSPPDAAHRSRVPPRQLGVVAQPPLGHLRRPADQQLRLHGQELRPESLPSLTRSCSPAMPPNPTPHRPEPPGIDSTRCPLAPTAARKRRNGRASARSAGSPRPRSRAPRDCARS